MKIRGGAGAQPTRSGNTPAAGSGERRMQIMLVAARLFVERGYRATSLQDVADVFGVTRPALYYYFASKDELLYAILSHALDVNDETTAAVFAATTDPELRLARLVQAEVLDITREAERPLTPLMVAEMGELAPGHYREIARRRRRHYERHRALLEEIDAAGGLRDVDTTVATLGLLALIARVMEWFRPDGRLDGEQVAFEVTKIALGALLARPDPVIAALRQEQG